MLVGLLRRGRRIGAKRPRRRARKHSDSCLPSRTATIAGSRCGAQKVELGAGLARAPRKFALRHDESLGASIPRRDGSAADCSRIFAADGNHDRLGRAHHGRAHAGRRAGHCARSGEKIFKGLPRGRRAMRAWRSLLRQGGLKRNAVARRTFPPATARFRRCSAVSREVAVARTVGVMAPRRRKINLIGHIRARRSVCRRKQPRWATIVGVPAHRIVGAEFATFRETRVFVSHAQRGGQPEDRAPSSSGRRHFADSLIGSIRSLRSCESDEPSPPERSHGGEQKCVLGAALSRAEVLLIDEAVRVGLSWSCRNFSS